jgi:hypothetical protein
MGSCMEAAYKRALVVLCLFLGACGDSGQRLQCGDAALTSECQGLLRACGSDANATPQTVIATSAAERLTACLKRSYAARCNAACQLAE